MKNPQPLAYSPAFEIPEKDEAQTTHDLAQTMLGISRKVYNDTHHAKRSVHVKSHALLEGDLKIHDNLPPYLAQGIFATPGTHAAILRLSATPGDLLPDAVSTPRGLALKIMDVNGERLPGSEDTTTQDFLMVNGPVFQVQSAKAFLKNLKPIAKTTDRFQKTKQVVSAVMRATSKTIIAMGGHAGKIKNMGGEPPHHPLGETYFTQAPILYGPYMAKISLAPVLDDMIALKGKKIDITANAVAIRNALRDYFAAKPAQWHLRVQLCTDIDAMPIEDSSVEWSEDESPFITVATLTMPAQNAWTEEKSKRIDDAMSFSPWHGIAAHRPIGSIGRVRKLAYEMSTRFRAERNGLGTTGSEITGTCPYIKKIA